MSIKKPVYQLSLALELQEPEGELQSVEEARSRSDAVKHALESLYGKAGAPRWLDDYVYPTRKRCST
jgi:hypothetical protein